MKLRRLNIKKYKSLKNIEIKFVKNSEREEMNKNYFDSEPLDTIVLIGKNGTGKTSVLEFIFNFFEIFKLSIFSNDTSIIIRNRIAFDSNIGQIEVNLERESRFNNFNLSEWVFKNRNNSMNLKDLPRIVYIPVEMNYSELNNKQQNFIPVPKFLQKIDSQVVENIPSYITTRIMKETLLQNNITTDKVRENIFNEFNDLFRDMNLDIKLKEISPETLLPVFVKDNDKFDINSLSSGEKQIFLRILSLKMLDINNSVILIDEPETSLHPSWQQKIVKLYEKVGKNNQLIIATQSPFIVGGIKSENIIIFLRENGEVKIKYGDEVEEVYGQPVERVLKDIMEMSGVRAPEIDEKLEKLREMVDDNKFDTEEYIKEREELGRILGFDTDLMMIDLDVKKKKRDRDAENK